MAIYNIYAGSCNGLTYMYSDDFVNEDEAVSVAYQEAIEDYHSYEGYHELRDYAQVMEDYCEEHGIDEDSLTDDDHSNIQSEYDEEVEGWIQYAVILEKDDPDHDYY